MTLLQLERIILGGIYTTILTHLDLSDNHLIGLPDSISNFSELTYLDLSNNHFTSLPDSISSLLKLTHLNLNNNPSLDLSNLSILQNLPNLKEVSFVGVNLPRRYWTKPSDWQAEWLLDEDNTEIRRTLIEQLGYEKICEQLNTTTRDTWREYTLLEIDGIERFHRLMRLRHQEPMVLLKMTCPSTGHIHILRVPPEMTSAEAAITWVNHGIHPDEFTVQT